MNKLSYNKSKWVFLVWLQSAQSTVEYLVLLGAVTTIVLVGFNQFITRSREQAEIIFTQVSSGIMGDSPGSAVSSPIRNNYP